MEENTVGSIEEYSIFDEFVLDRKDIVYVMKALCKGNKKDKAFAKYEIYA